MNVGERFRALLSNVALTAAQRSDGITKHNGVCDCLNRWYYQKPSPTANAMLVGSWGKQTEVRPPRDIDLLFVLRNGMIGGRARRRRTKRSVTLCPRCHVVRTTLARIC
jgi:Second Messenger Oligonucleotide or Dinucleotide Synthetase domain